MKVLQMEVLTFNLYHSLPKAADDNLMMLTYFSQKIHFLGKYEKYFKMSSAEILTSKLSILSGLDIFIKSPQ